MSSLDKYVGQLLDDKYRLERQLGQGGMGAVYLATHLGTDRFVALKLIAPEFMRNEEFVQRFQREARAAGRLRHPNVVDVTDFGFARASGETVAYLVMEYLDGCTLADVLKEEKRLPLEWVVDILEQVCSAVNEAHQQGIVHRDLKPENIWLEPNRLGSYRVKVLDFGIAKLSGGDTFESQRLTADIAAEAVVTQAVRSDSRQLETDTLLFDDVERPGLQQESAVKVTVAPQSAEGNNAEPLAPTNAVEGAATALFTHGAPTSDEDGKTLRFDRGTRQVPLPNPATVPPTTTGGTELTRVGAIMGTPLYMSPEQCAAKNLDARSDIYSLGVIAFQMLAGDPPFGGDTAAILRGHLENPPPNLRELVKKVPRRVAQTVTSALAKDPADRPPTAVAFANSLRAQADSIGSLYRRAGALYSEHFPKFLKLSFIAHIPVIVTTLAVIALQFAERAQPQGLGVVRITLIVALVIVVILQVISYFLAASAISGMTAVIVTQVSAAPLRPVELRTPFAFLKKRWRPFLKTSIRVTLRIIIGYVLLIIPGVVMSVRYALYAPVVLMEGLEKKAAMKRARELASRSWRTVIIVSLLQFVIPMTVSAFLGRLTVKRTSGGSGWTVQTITKQLSGLVNIFIIPLMSIVPALLYLKMRQFGGETLTQVWEQIEQVDTARSEWQQRMRTRLTTNPGRASRQSAAAAWTSGQVESHRG
ncbi:MAG TPA: protein kinase [Pyrinomonadaceae bacterium]|nr:protein kinase [Pyrinomonadaceae bacterium]